MQTLWMLLPVTTLCIATSSRKQIEGSIPRTSLSCTDSSNQPIASGESFHPPNTPLCTICTCEHGRPENCTNYKCTYSPTYCLDSPSMRATKRCCSWDCNLIESTSIAPHLSRKEVYKHCIDSDGNLIPSGQTFSPVRSIPCHVCTCENGVLENCLYTVVTVNPQDCHKPIVYFHICYQAKLREECNNVGPNSPCFFKDLHLEHGHMLDCNNDGFLEHSTHARIQCKEGYTIRGTDVIICRHGEWETHGVCTASCRASELPKHVIVDSQKDVFLVQESVQIQCKEGFFVKNNHPVQKLFLICVGVNEWSRENLECFPENKFHLHSPTERFNSIETIYMPRSVITLPCKIKPGECTDDCLPSAHIQYLWIKDKEQIEHFFKRFAKEYKINSDGSLVFYAFGRSVEGIYFCIRQCTYTKHVCGVSTYTVAQESQCLDKMTQNTTQYREKDFAYLPCPVFQYNSPGLLWKKDGIEIGNNERVSILKDGSLFIKSLESDDAGAYTCTAYPRLNECRKSHTHRIVFSPSTRNACGRFQDKENPYFSLVTIWINGRRSCYGTVISDRWIVTTAQCASNNDSQIEFHIQTDLYPVRRRITHPHYVRRELDNHDIGLIELLDPIPLKSDMVFPCLMTDQIEQSLMRQGLCDTNQNITGEVFVMDHAQRHKSPLFLSRKGVALFQHRCPKFTAPNSEAFLFCAVPSPRERSVSANLPGAPFVVRSESKLYLLGTYIYGSRISLSANENDNYFVRLTRFYDWIHNYV